VTEDNIQYFKPIVRSQALPSVVLRCVRDSSGLPIGFISVGRSERDGMGKPFPPLHMRYAG
jgi:putative acetyltransferase